MIEIRNLTVEFGGVRGLNDLSADLGAKITGLVGPNGAGKTTLLNVLSGFVKRSSGSVSVDGEDLLKIAINRRAISAYAARSTGAGRRELDRLEQRGRGARQSIDRSEISERADRRRIELCRIIEQ